MSRSAEKQATNVSNPIRVCACCGSGRFSAGKVLWPTLIREWGLCEDEVEYIDRQQGLRCLQCGSNLRSMALALAICRSYDHKGTLADFVEGSAARRLRVLEINEAGNLTQFLSKLPAHVLGRYPQVDMLRIPYPEASYDLVVHSDTLEHVPDPVLALQECHRVLAPGGYCAFTVPMILGRMTRTRAGLTPTYHGSENESSADMAVQTEYGCDAWKHVVLAGFQECRMVAAEFPSAFAFVGVRHGNLTASHPLDDNNGERLVPEVSDGATFWEHVYRYAFASRFITGKRVLDIACGEGYGAAALAKAGAAQAIGVDLSESACLHARKKYGLDARVGNAERIPLPDQSIDVVVSFETIEHVPNPERFLDECLRVLVPGGMLILSTPNKQIHTDTLGARNPHHCSEFTQKQLAAALRVRFRNIRYYTQRLYSAAWWSERSLVSESTPWRRIRGFSRLRLAIQRRIFPEAINDPTPRERRSVVELVLRIAGSHRSLLNPYVVRPLRGLDREQSVYLLAIATR